VSRIHVPSSPPVTPVAIDTAIPFRLDRLPWSRFHWRLVMALGITWVLDGLEATVVGSLGPVLQSPATLGFTASQLGLAGTLYLAGAIGGALLFGYLTDQLGRKRLFTVTLGIYLAGALLTAVAWDFWSFVLFRVVTGMAIGGEYSAINSAIDEFIPARVRGQVDLIVNGTYWVGAAAGAAASLVLLAPNSGIIVDLNGRDDRYTTAANHEQGYMLVRSRHSGGANYTLADGHVKWYKAPDNYQAQSLSGVCWRSPKQGAMFAGCSAWFSAIGD